MTQVTIKTSVGDIQLELDGEKAPITVENFVSIANSGLRLFEREAAAALAPSTERDQVRTLVVGDDGAVGPTRDEDRAGDV